MLEQIPTPPKDMFRSACVTFMAIAGEGTYAGVTMPLDATKEKIEWWVNVAPKAQYLIPVTMSGSGKDVRVADGVSAMCLMQAGDIKTVTPMLPVDEEDTEIILIYLQQLGVKIPWDRLYKESRDG